MDDREKIAALVLDRLGQLFVVERIDYSEVSLRSGKIVDPITEKPYGSYYTEAFLAPKDDYADAVSQHLDELMGKLTEAKAQVGGKIKLLNGPVALVTDADESFLIRLWLDCVIVHAD